MNTSYNIVGSYVNVPIGGLESVEGASIKLPHICSELLNEITTIDTGKSSHLSKQTATTLDELFQQKNFSSALQPNMHSEEALQQLADELDVDVSMFVEPPIDMSEKKPSSYIKHRPNWFYNFLDQK